jgi:Flp pilus assembly protein TadG
MRRLKSLVCGEDATELVEFAIASTVFLTFLFGIIEFCMVIYAGNFVSYAAQHGARYAMVRGSDWSSSCASVSSYACQASADNVQGYILGLPHPGMSLTTSNITPTWPGTTALGTSCGTKIYAQGCQVKVTVSYVFGLGIPFIPAQYSSIPLTSTSIETIQD